MLRVPSSSRGGLAIGKYALGTARSSSAGTTAPFIGNAAVVDVLAAPACAAALVVGEPGAGKSRALAQARRRWEATGTDVVTVTCLPGAASVAFDPLITLARTLYAQGRLPLRVQRAVAANGATRLQNACEAFERAASAGPLTIQIDDLHCADPDTLTALRYCIDRLCDLPLTWNLATRPGHAESDELGAVLSRAHQADVIELDGLSADEVGALARALAPERAFDDDAVARLHERTGGNPLYVELLVQDRDDELAPSLRRALAERVRALAPDALAVAGALAAAGVPLHVAALEALTRRPPARVAAALASLVEGRVLRRVEGGYAFRHGLLRDACREANADAAPPQAHDDAAAFPARPAADAALGPAALFALGASHEAHDDLHAARDAVDRALAQHDAARDASLAIRLHARRAAIEGHLGNPEEGIAQLETVAEQAVAHGLRGEVAQCCIDLCALCEMTGEDARFERWCRAGLEAAGPDGSAERTRLVTNLAHVALTQGRLREALTLSGAAASAARRHGEPADRSRALALQARLGAMLGEFASASTAADEAHDLAPPGRAQRRAALARATVHELHGDQLAALAAYGEAVRDVPEDTHRDVDEVAALTGIVRCACGLGRAARAHDALGRLRAAGRFGWALARRHAHEAEGFVALLDGDTARGCDELLRANELGGDPFRRASLLLRVADARKDRKLFLGVIERFDAMEAFHAADAARALARAHGLRPGRKREPQNTLSAREGSVAILVASGMTNSEIGTLLHITARTVEYHVGNILTKCGLRSRVEVATRIAAGQLQIAATASEAATPADR